MNNSKKKPIIKTPQDARAPQDENPVDTPAETGKKKSKTTNDPPNRVKRENHHP
jgi:hypothetical protein